MAPESGEGWLTTTGPGRLAHPWPGQPWNLLSRGACEGLSDPERILCPFWLSEKKEPGIVL